MDDIAALVREIRISNERQERLLSLVQDRIQLKDCTTNNGTNVPLDACNGQELEKSNSAARDLSHSQEMTQEKIEGLVDIFLQGFGFSLADPSHLGKYRDNSPTLQIPDGRKLVKVRWGSDDKYDENLMKNVRRRWKDAVKLRSSIFELGYHPSGYPMDWVMMNEDIKHPYPFGTCQYNHSIPGESTDVLIES
jgi:hypothetical protein